MERWPWNMREAQGYSRTPVGQPACEPDGVRVGHCPQVVLAMKRGRRDGRPLRYAAARAALWLLNDLPARLETLLFPGDVRQPVCTRAAAEQTAAL